MMRKIAFITYDALPELTDEEKDVADRLRQHNVFAEAAIWSDKTTQWKEYAFVIFRSTWDYFKRIEEFKSFLDYLEQESIRTYNSTAIVRQNMDKNYLSDLEKKNISICPSVFCRKGISTDLENIMISNHWETIVCKPTISGTAFHTYKVHLSEAENFQQQFDKLLQNHEMIVQPFFPEIETFGEKSFIYFHKQFSHAIVKKVMRGDFRVQGEFGGTVHAYPPTQIELDYTKQILDSIDEQLLYARVDFLTANNKNYLMELELFEPALYLISDTAKNNFVRAILNIEI